MRDSIEREIRGAKLTRARRRIRVLARKGIPRAQRARFARLAGECGIPRLGLRLLEPVPFAACREDSEPSEEENKAYAGCLIQLGEYSEAIRFLERRDRGFPEKALYRAMALMGQWDTRAAIPVLREYLSVSTISYSSRRLAAAGFAEGLVREREAYRTVGFLSYLLHEAKHHEDALLVARASELAGEHLLKSRGFARAQAFAAQAEILYREGEDADRARAMAIRYTADYLARPRDAGSVRALQRFRREAERMGQWEVVREIDRQIALHGCDPLLLSRLYWGTPWPAYREKLLEAVRGWRPEPDYLLWWDAPVRNAPVLDLNDGKIGPHKVLAPGSVLHRALVILTRDSYRPCRLSTLSRDLYPDSDPPRPELVGRTRETLRRLRAALRSAGFPLQIQERAGECHVRPLAPCALRFSGTGPSDQKDHALRELEVHFGPREFTLEQVARHLSLSPRSAQRLMETAMRRGGIIRSRVGNKVSYQLCTRSRMG